MFLLRALPALSLCIICTLAPARAAWAGDGPPRIVVAQFGDSLPEGWTVEVRHGEPKFRVAEGALHLKSEHDSYGLRKEVSIDLKEYPYLNWRWKAAALPKGGDGRQPATDDQAAQVYVVFPRWPVSLRSQLIGYTWENGAPRGSSFACARRGSTRYIVMRDRSDELGQWVKERRNVYEDYRRLFDSEPPEVGAVLLYINSQHTGTPCESYISEVYFSKN